MNTKKDYSYGVVPVHKKVDGSLEFFILNQISYRGDIYWSLPKGHPESNETTQETALRELFEEAGLKAKLDDRETFSQSYSFTHEGVTIEKTVTYYLGWVEDKDFTLQTTEVAEAKWCSFAEASVTLTHEASKQILGQVREYLLKDFQPL